MIPMFVRQVFAHLPRPKKRPSEPFLSPVRAFPGPPNKLLLSQEFSPWRGPQHGIISLHRSIGQNLCMIASFLPDTEAEEKLSSVGVSRFYTISMWAQSCCNRDPHLQQMAEKPHALTHNGNKQKSSDPSSLPACFTVLRPHKTIISAHQSTAAGLQHSLQPFPGKWAH